MLAWLHKQFIPHEGNDHKPHFLRPRNAAKVLAFVVALEVILMSQVYVFPQFKDFLAAILPGVLVELTNGSRIDVNAGNLAVNPLLVISAQMKAEHMAKNGYFAHDSPTGESPWYWFGQSGYKFLYAGENLAVHFVDSEDVHRAWMASVTHRANILNPNFTEIGIGIAQGAFQGRSAIFIVQHFGRPMGGSIQPNPLLAVGANSGGKTETGNNSTIAGEETKKSETEIASTPTGTVETSAETGENPAADIGGEFAGSITISETNFIKKLLSMPNNLTAFIYYFVLLVVAAALALKVFIKIRIQHPSLILIGLALLFVISGVIVTNYYLLTLPGQI